MQDKDDLVKWTAMEAVAKMGEEAIAFADTLAAAVEKGRHTDAHMAKIAAGNWFMHLLELGESFVQDDECFTPTVSPAIDWAGLSAAALRSIFRDLGFRV